MNKEESSLSKNINKPKELEKSNFPKRPKLNEQIRNKNTSIILQSNFLKMRFNPNQNHVRQFSIKINPDLPEDSYQLFRKILKSISKELKQHFKLYLISGRSLFSTLNDENSSITLKTQLDNIEYDIEITKTKNLIDLSQITTLNNENIQIKSLIERIIKMLLEANDGFIRFDGGNFYNYYKYEKIDGNSKKLPGFSTGTVITDSGLYLRVIDRTKFISGQTAYEKLKEIYSKHKSNNPKNSCIEYFENKSVLSNYGNLKVYKIESISFDKTPSNTNISIKKDDGSYVNVNLNNYYKEKYSIQIKDLNQPLLIVNDRRKNKENNELNKEDKIYLIPELVFLCGADENDNNIEKKRKMGNILKPNERMEKIKKINELLVNPHHKYFKKSKSSEKIQLESPNEIRQKWGLEFEKFQTFKGRILPKPQIFFFNDIKDNNEKKDGKIQQQKFYQSINLEKDIWLILSNYRANGEKAFENLVKCSTQMGITIEKPEIMELKGKNDNEYINKLRTIDLNQGKKIVLIILDNYSKKYYPSIKNYLCGQIGIVSQCIIWEKAKSQNLSYWSNILKQMEAKLGAQPFTIMVNSNFKKNITMIIGIVISKIGKNKIRIIMTSTYSKGLCNYLTQIKESDFNDKESTLLFMTQNAINHIKKIFNMPKFIIIYRLGGNTKQTEKIYHEEVTSYIYFFSKENKFFNENIPLWCFISINKKTELKFFEITENRYLNNPRIGTVIDTEVTNSDYYEFYLQPQYVNMGTATPVHYHCLFDSTQMPIEIMEEITYNMTYYYWNWNGPIREPAALKFADVCNSFIGKIKIEGNVNNQLDIYPYYI